MPATLLTHVPMVRLARAPNRHVVVAMIGLSILAAAGWQRLARHRVAAATVLLLIAFEYWPAWHRVSPTHAGSRWRAFR